MFARVLSSCFARCQVTRDWARAVLPEPMHGSICGRGTHTAVLPLDVAFARGGILVTLDQQKAFDSFFFHAFFRQQQGPTPTRSKHGPGVGPVRRSSRRLGPSGSGTNGSWSRSLRRNAISAAACGPAWERKSARWDGDKEGSSTWSRKKRFRVRDAQCCHPCLHSPGAAIP